jgi:sec-independent protein translocase protein TatA
MAGLTGWHLLILLAVVVLLFGAKRLPDMARAVGQSARILKGEMNHPGSGGGSVLSGGWRDGPIFEAPS